MKHWWSDSHSKEPTQTDLLGSVEFSAPRGEHLVKLPFLAWLLSNPLISFQVDPSSVRGTVPTVSEGKIHMLRLGYLEAYTEYSEWHEGWGRPSQNITFNI